MDYFGPVEVKEDVPLQNVMESFLLAWKVEQFIWKSPILWTLIHASTLYEDLFADEGK